MDIAYLLILQSFRTRIGGALVSVALMLYANLKSYPMDYDAAGALIVDPAKMAIDSYKNAGMGLGFFLGWFLERRFIRFSTEGSWWERLIRYAVLAVSYVLVKDLMKWLVGLCLTGGIASAAEAFGYTLYLVAGAPVLIKLSKKVLPQKVNCGLKTRKAALPPIAVGKRRFFWAFSANNRFWKKGKALLKRPASILNGRRPVFCGVPSACVPKCGSHRRIRLNVSRLLRFKRKTP